MECSVIDYDLGIIKKHELTRKEREEDVLNMMDYQGANTGAVLLGYEDNEIIDDIVLKVVINNEPTLNLVTQDGVRHTLWKMTI